MQVGAGTGQITAAQPFASHSHVGLGSGSAEIGSQVVDQRPFQLRAFGRRSAAKHSFVDQLLQLLQRFESGRLPALVLGADLADLPNLELWSVGLRRTLIALTQQQRAQTDPHE